MTEQTTQAIALKPGDVLRYPLTEHHCRQGTAKLEAAADHTTGQIAQLSILHGRGWRVVTHEVDDTQRLRVTGTQPDGTMFRGWLDADGQFTGQPTDPARSTQRFGVGAPTEVRS